MTTSIEEALRSGAWHDYDAGLLNDFGGGNVDWWQDYLRAEIGRTNDFWRSQISSPDPALVALKEERDRLKVERDEARGVLSGLSSYLGAGLGDDATTAEQFDRRIREGIEITYAPMIAAWRKEMAR